MSLFAALFLYAVADWLRLLPGEQGYGPLRFLLLTAALLLQPVAMLLRARSGIVFYVLLLSSVALLAGTFVVAG